jgi:deazaflavin-dependent oxidoreductase (nitroreductase family)
MWRLYVMPFTVRGNWKDDRGQARSKPSGLDGGACQPSPFQRRRQRRWAHAQADPGGPAGHDRSVAVIDDGRRKSGERFIFPLYYGKAGDRYIVVASKGGAPQRPGWYRYLLANPDVELQVGTEKFKARARTATGEERTQLWQEALKFWLPYADYQKNTERQIPVVVLGPVR